MGVAGKRAGHSGDLRETFLHLKGLSAPAQLLGPPELEQCLSAVVAGWPSRQDDVPGAAPFATLALTDRGYRLSSPFAPGPRLHADAVNAVCDLVVEIIWQLLRDDASLLCLHAAAVETKSGLIAFPATRRAGKSLLVTTLAHRGAKLFGDDFLPLRSVPGTALAGMAGGIAPRLRLPLPQALSPHLLEFLNASPHWQNRQYRYLPAIDGAPHGATAPLAALVLLNRTESGRATLAPVGRGTMLRALLKQNFARSATGDHILNAVYALAESTPAWQVTFCDVEEAADLILERIGSADARAPVVFQPPAQAAVAAPVHADAGADPLRRFVQLPGAQVRNLDGDQFAASADLRSILHMDEGASRIWTLLQRPTSLREAVEVLTTAFPDVPAGRIAAETGEVLQALAVAGLVVPAPTPARMPGEAGAS
jgi:hypothetical protein